MASRIAAAAVKFLENQVAAILITVTQHKGSTPRHAGAQMLVSQSIAIDTIGGGNLELSAIHHAKAMLLSNQSTDAKHYALGPGLGQCCGGAVDLSFVRLDAHSIRLVEQRPPRFHLQLYGAGHVGKAIAHALLPINCTVQWIDERDEHYPFDGLQTFAQCAIETICVDSVSAEVANAPRDSFYLVLTHSHDLDLQIIEAILKRGDFAFCGLIGSATKRARFKNLLMAKGFSEELIDRINCPIGITDIVGKEPEIIATSVVAQLLKTSIPTTENQ